MRVIALGVSHHSTPVELREQLAFSPGDTPGALTRLSALNGVDEVVLLSTCNRTEVYAAGPAVDREIASMTAVLADLRGLPPGAIRDHIYVHREMAAVRHLFRVAAGLDSMVLGETQILGQVRDAYRFAVETGVVGKVMHHLMHQALAAAKRAHSETGISEMAVSVSYAAVELARKLFRSLEGRSVLCIGAGETAELTLRHLAAAGANQVVVANRTLERAERLADEFGGRAVPLDAIPAVLPTVDVVISSTGAPEYVLTRTQLQQALRTRRGRPIFLFDIAVPRDVDPAAGSLEGTFLYDIDDLKQVVAQNLQERAREARRAERILEEEVERFAAWVSTQEVVPTIRGLREQINAIRQRELQKSFNKLPDLGEGERKVIEGMTAAMVNKVLNEPTQRLKRMAEQDPERAAAAAALLEELFGLEVARAEDPEAAAAQEKALRASWGPREECPRASREVSRPAEVRAVAQGEP